ncbi:UDP-N-acetylmuramoyl-tripeptide--D-alanyl-D-alanine ligase [Arcanobacterium hippocoleae]|uniref:UDP-N-acetylmuramoyl-tripeptide--D-alanyl-D-alanine ligase n=1 Tax=Arcanobacterium hippocoleae TaxID=149017 RepID=A0ABU1T0W6_9ACTO|nr:UDP-N-acetylmuramoyl-tripeptide--D-alanyl-D-alanine ligase [Arcanobacterium hippocoleae]MDR6939006.1 UDP-N-acetylmuramoyl-tripeptide--D-alanyl-D-alanine ligase [Arcanobacterium hippocoleae]
MVNLSVAEVLRAVQGQLAGADDAFRQLRISGVVTDNRQITGGELFVAITGERTDGNEYAQAALAAGATAVLTANPALAQKSGAPPERLILVADPVYALGQLAKSWLAYLRAQTHADLKVIGITGSVGKTTTKDLLAKILTHRGNVVAPPNSFNNEIGLALTVLRADFQTASLVLEMGADRLGNISYLTDIAPLDVSVVLAVAKAHLGAFGSLENTIQEKAQIIHGTAPDGMVLLNADDPNVAKMSAQANCQVQYFSAMPRKENDQDDPNQILAQAVNISANAARPSFTLHLAGESAECELGLPGLHNISNALAASAVAASLGVPFLEICAELGTAKAGSPHRMDVHQAGKILVIDDAYNANPASMRAGIAAFGQLGKKYRRKVVVLGQMLELGDVSSQEHQALLPSLLAADVTDLFLVGEAAFALTPIAREAGINVVEYVSVDLLRADIHTVVVPDTAILFKGSNGTRVWQIAAEVINGMDEGLNK